MAAATKSTADKLLIKPDSTVWSSHADRLSLLGPLPGGVEVAGGLDTATTAIVFADDASGIQSFLEAHRDHLAAPEHLWVLYPKGNKANINRDTLWPILGGYGLRPITQISVDDTWSALRFRPLREGEPQFNGGR